MRGLIFDFNGTLFWDSEKHEQAWRQLALRHSSRSISREEFQKYIHGRVNRSIIEYLFGPGIDPSQIGALIEEKENLYLELCIEEKEILQLAPGAIQLLDKLVRHDVPRAIATSSRKQTVDFFVSSFDLLRWFSPEVIVHDDGTFPGKPEPHIFLNAARRIATPPSDCVVFEDSHSGIQSAKRAGIGRIIAVKSYSGDDRGEFADAHAVISDFHDIEKNLWFGS